MQLIQRFYPVIMDYLEQNSFVREPKGLYEPVDYIMQLGGKRLRPILALAACDLFGTDYKKALPAALAVEVFHNFSLVHDDIMDDATLRRGKPTVHEKYDTNTAILSGDVMLILAYKSLCETADKSLTPRLIDIFNETAELVCEGQQYDMEFETSDEITIAQYLKMIELKTAALLRGSLQMGAVIGGVEEDDFYHISEYGRKVGIAFQLQDDFLDTFGDNQKVGKKRGGDILQNKKTWMILKAYEVADPERKNALKTWMKDKTGDEDQKIEAVTKILEDLNIPDMTVALMKKYRDEALDHLTKLTGAKAAVSGLEELANLIIVRDY
ncbi:MAG: polyprenyl synthetase family protein [Bacteroidetes bacterium]|nr:MAG: polyprenyl synthetase family protein [Bacteroidota bacterium]